MSLQGQGLGTDPLDMCTISQGFIRTPLASSGITIFLSAVWSDTGAWGSIEYLGVGLEGEVKIKFCLSSSAYGGVTEVSQYKVMLSLLCGQ